MILLLEQLLSVCQQTVVVMTALITLLTPQFGGIDTTNINGKNISFAYTDENIGESLIIKTEKKEYLGFGKFSIPFTITNTAQSQNVIISIATQNGWEVGGIEEFVRNDIVKVPSIPAITTGSTTPEITFPDIVTSVWSSGNLIKPSNISLKRSLANKTGAVFHLNINETKTFRVIFNKVGLGEFIIEAFGAKSGYGNLDPWVFEDKFNSDTKSIGNLNGQDSWSLVEGEDVWTVQTVSKYEGNQGVSCLHITTDSVIGFPVTAAVSGTMYIALMRATGAGNNKLKVQLYDAAVNAVQFTLMQDSNVYYQARGAGVVDFDDFVYGTWGVLKIVFDGVGDTMNLQWYNGTSWGTATGNLDSTTAFVDVDNIVISSVYNTAGALNDYIDTVTPTDPTAPPPAPIIPNVGQFILFEE